MARRRGIVLVSMMAFIIVVLMLATTLLGLNRQGLLYIGHHRDRVRAAQMARGGLNHMAHLLTYQPLHGSVAPCPPDIVVGSSDLKYRITFDPADPDRTVVNLANPAASTTLSAAGSPVKPFSADVVVVGTSGWVNVRVHAVLTKLLQFDRSLGSVGRIGISSDCLVDGIRSLRDPVPTGGGLVSSHAPTSASDFAITFQEGTGTFQLRNQSRLEAPPAPNPGWHSVSDWLRNNFGAQVSESGGTRIPEFDVNALVKGRDACPAPPGVSGSGGSHYLNTTTLTDERYVAGNVTINGDLNLSKGAIYVKGDLVVNGGIRGEGSVFVDGSVTVRGGTSAVMTNQASGATLLASGNVTLEGLDAGGYLDALAQAHPTTVGPALQDFRDKMTQMQAAAAANDNGTLWWGSNELTRHLGAGPPAGADYYVCPIANPSGGFPDGTSDGLVPRLVNRIQTSLGPAYQDDAKARKVVGALNEIFSHFRHSADFAPSNVAVDPSGHIPGVIGWSQYDAIRVKGRWDDPGNADKSTWTVDRLWNDAGWGSANNATAGANSRAFFTHNPLDMSWLGRSSFQGIVYAGGNLNASNKFRVIGAMLCKGSTTLTGGSTLIYDEEYMRPTSTYGPVGIVLYEEL